MERSTCRSKAHAPPLQQQAQPEFHLQFPVQDRTPVQACREAHFVGPPYSLTRSLPIHLWIAGKTGTWALTIWQAPKTRNASIPGQASKPWRQRALKVCLYRYCLTL